MELPHRRIEPTGLAMLNMLKRLLSDERGFVVTSELILISTVLCLGMIVGLTEVSHAISRELIDVANAFNRLNHGWRHHSLGWNDDHGRWSDAWETGAESEGGDMGDW